MATADELLGMISDVTDDFLVVDPDTRIISIPASIKILGVESDDDVKHLRFKVPKQYGEFDLSTFSIQVNFENANGEGDFYLVNDLAVLDDGNMTFSWLVDRHAFARAGEVDFSLCMKKFDEEGTVVKEFNTAIATLPVLKGLETTEAVVEDNASAFDCVLFRLYAVEAATGNSTNGYYTVVTVNETEEGVEVSIFGTDGVRVATIRHGVDGKDGYTPVRGVDYWTDEDKTVIQTESKNYIDSFAPQPTTVTLAADSWTDKLQTVTVSGVEPNSVLFVGAGTEKENRELYADCGVYCVGQDVNSLTFECDLIPKVDLTVNVVMFHTIEQAE